ncbi:MAG: hypothetical protein ACOC5T_02940 [Elusimicrobiota bacterium]
MFHTRFAYNFDKIDKEKKTKQIMARNIKAKKRTKFEREMDKRVDARMKELYLDKEFRLKLEKEVADLKTLDDLAKYQKNSANISRQEIENE